VHFQESLDRAWSVMAWQQGTPMAENAGFRRIALMGEIGAEAHLVLECEKYLTRYPASNRRDHVVMSLAAAQFNLGNYDEAKKSAQQLWNDQWSIIEHGRKVMRLSQFRAQAGFLLGRIAHVAGAYAEATEWYGRVKDSIPDAMQSYRFFTSRELELEPLVRTNPANAVKLKYEGKNLKKIVVQVYPVDLTVLFAVKNSFEAMTNTDLAGVLPSRELEVESELAPLVRGEGVVDLGKMKPGAYLVILREGDRAASTLLLNNGANLTIQRSNGTVRAYLTDAEGRPVADAAIKCGSDGHIFHTGRTDERGLMDVSDPGGRLTIVAEKGEVVAVTTSR
jgi:hypothetical protein